MPFGLLMRKMYGQDGTPLDFKEYHTSLDDKSLISTSTMIESIKLILGFKL